MVIDSDKEDLDAFLTTPNDKTSDVAAVNYERSVAEKSDLDVTEGTPTSIVSDDASDDAFEINRTSEDEDEDEEEVRPPGIDVKPDIEAPSDVSSAPGL